MNLFKIVSLVILMLIFSCIEKNDWKESEETFIINEEKQEEIIEKYLRNGAWKHELYSMEWQEEINKGLAQDSTIAYLWQQKAMPLFKQRKYEAGMEFIDKAVQYDPERWQDYRAFIKCIFAKTYREAIIDFEDYKEKYGNSYVMDHTYDFYIGLSYLQLNEFEKAEEVLETDYKYQLEQYGEDWLHHLDLFYLGIAKYEQKKYLEAILFFDKALKIYPDFSEVQLYKADCLRRTGKYAEAMELQKLGEINGRKGNTINEDNVIYEIYPYQIRWY